MTVEQKPQTTQARLTGVSLGPGSPDLITVRGLEALRSSDIIYYPVAVPGHESRCLTVLRHWGLEGAAKPFSVDMKDRESAERSYGGVRNAVRADIGRGLRVAVVCEGCVSLYSTVFRVLGAGGFHGGFQPSGFEPDGFELVPGVSSPSAAAAEAGVCLALGGGGVAVVAGGLPEEVEAAVERFETVVVLKPAPGIAPLIRKKGLDFVFCRDLGGESQLVTARPEDIAGDSFPYFSLFIISKRLNKCREP